MNPASAKTCLFGSALCVLTLMVGCGSETPQKTYEEICRRATTGDWRVVYDSHCRDAKAKLDEIYAQFMGELGRGPGGAAKAEDAQKRWPTTRHYFTDAIAHSQEAQNMFIGAKVLESTIDGDRAVLTVRLPNLDGGSVTEVFMRMEDDGWKLEMPD